MACESLLLDACVTFGHIPPDSGILVAPFFWAVSINDQNTLQTKVILDRARCESVARVLKGIEIIDAAEDSSLQIPREILPDFYLVLVWSLIHETLFG